MADVVIFTVGPWHNRPWWWEHTKYEIQGCAVKYIRITPPGNIREGQISLRHIPRLSVEIAIALRINNPKYVYTFECGWASLLVSFMQSLGYKRKTRHVILQFIMREKDRTIRSMLKYLFMRFIFSSAHIAICSSTKEAQYYQKVFRWNEGKTKFIPFHTDPKYLETKSEESGGYVFSAGRTFRDYDTFVSAVEAIDVKAIVVGPTALVRRKQIPDNVSFQCNISIEEMTELMRRSMLVVVPLEDRSISIGQSVILHAMAMGKAVIATKTAGTEDYIEDGITGMLVAPGDCAAMKTSIQYLLKNREARARLGANARQRAEDAYMPIHYAKSVRRIIHNDCSEKEMHSSM